MWQVWVSSSMLIFRHVVIYCWRRQYGDSADLGELWGGDDQRAKKHAHMGRCLANLILVDVHRCFATSLYTSNNQTGWEGRFDCIWEVLRFLDIQDLVDVGTVRRAWILLQMIHGECCGRCLYPFIPLILLGLLPWWMLEIHLEIKDPFRQFLILAAFWPYKSNKNTAYLSLEVVYL